MADDLKTARRRGAGLQTLDLIIFKLKTEPQSTQIMVVVIPCSALVTLHTITEPPASISPQSTTTWRSTRPAKPIERSPALFGEDLRAEVASALSTIRKTCSRCFVNRKPRSYQPS